MSCVRKSSRPRWWPSDNRHSWKRCNHATVDTPAQNLRQHGARINQQSNQTSLSAVNNNTPKTYPSIPNIIYCKNCTPQANSMNFKCLKASREKKKTQAKSVAVHFIQKDMCKARAKHHPTPVLQLSLIDSAFKTLPSSSTSLRASSC